MSKKSEVVKNAVESKSQSARKSLQRQIRGTKRDSANTKADKRGE